MEITIYKNIDDEWHVVKKGNQYALVHFDYERGQVYADCHGGTGGWVSRGGIGDNAIESVAHWVSLTTIRRRIKEYFVESPEYHDTTPDYPPKVYLAEELYDEKGNFLFQLAIESPSDVCYCKYSIVIRDDEGYKIHLWSERAYDWEGALELYKEAKDRKLEIWHEVWFGEEDEEEEDEEEDEEDEDCQVNDEDCNECLE